jgi:hypothetical protein
MTTYQTPWIEDLRYSIDVLSERGDLLEVLGRVHDLDAAHAVFETCRQRYPKKLISLRWKTQVIRDSVRD